MSDTEVRHLAPQEFIEFEVSSRAAIRVKIAYLGPVPDTDRAFIAIEVSYGDVDLT